KRTRADSVPVVNVQEASATPNAAPEIRQVQNAPEPSVITQRPVIAPKFARNAEMEDRRKARIEARNALAELRAQNQAQAKAPPETKPAEAEDAAQEASSESESDSDFDVMGVAPDDDLDPPEAVDGSDPSSDPAELANVCPSYSLDAKFK
ncbi:15912_t:CDS:2, partial [Acaulospora colombiana]